MQTPKFDLGVVRNKIDEWRKGKDFGWFSAPTCSIDYVIYLFGCTQMEAQNIIFDGLQRLSENDFSQRVLIWGEVADEYGLENYLGFNWYIKFIVGEDGVLEEISFHPCEKDMTLACGRTLTTSLTEERMPNWRKK